MEHASTWARVLAEPAHPALQVLGRLSDAVIVAGVDNRIVYANAAVTDLLGWALDDLLGQPVAVIVPERLRAVHIAGFERYRRTAEGNIIGQPTRVPALTSTGEERLIELVLSPLEVGEEPQHIAATLRDVGDRVDLERQSAVASRLLGVFARDLPEPELVPAVLKALGRALEMTATAFWVPADDDEQLVCRAFWHRPNEAGALLRDASGSTSFRRGEGLPGRVWLSGEPAWIADLAVDDNYTRRGAALADGLGAAFAFPVRARGEILGVVELYRSEPAEPDEQLLTLSSLIGRRLGEVLRNSHLEEERRRLADREISAAAALRASLLPGHLPDVEGADLGAAFRPGGEGVVGGDFYDVYRLDGGAGTPSRWGFMIGDVCGTGAEAAAVTAQVRYTARALMRAGLGLEPVMCHLNQGLLERPNSRFCTCMIGEFQAEPDGRVRVVLTNGGHPYPLLRTARGEVTTLPTSGRLLGVLHDVEPVTIEVVLDPGDLLLLYTDGVTEARGDGEFFGEDRLAALLASTTFESAAEAAALVERAAVTFAGRALTDDIAVLAIAAPDPRRGPA
jgi:phosphoserine phosphatase RsbU/P